MKFNKKTFYKIHQWVGIKLSILFFIVCFSGTLATLSVEMDWLFIPEIRAEKESSKVDFNHKFQNLYDAYPQSESVYWFSQTDSYVCDIVYITENNHRYYAFVNPYTGEVQGRVNLTFQRFFRDLHYFLFIPFQIGNFIVLTFGFLLFFSVATALLFFNKWYKHLFPLKLKTKNKEVMYRSLHRLVGAWSVPFIFIISLTGIWYFMERTNLGHISDIANPKAPILNNEKPFNYQDDKPFFLSIDFNKAIEVAKQTIPNLTIKDVKIPDSYNIPIYINGTSQVPLLRNRANRVYINPVNYEVVKVQRADNLSAITFINDAMDPIHFGTWGGLTTKIFWFFGGLSISTLILSGIWVALRRNAKRKLFGKKDKTSIGKWVNVNYLIILTMIGFMYYVLKNRYSVEPRIFYVVSIAIIVFIFIGWYIFIYRINKSLHK
ncbi:MAG: PepSY-associated TM helix domain-containing protein [Weeksellaceae bacterium]